MRTDCPEHMTSEFVNHSKNSRNVTSLWIYEAPNYYEHPWWGEMDENCEEEDGEQEEEDGVHFGNLVSCEKLCGNYTRNECSHSTSSLPKTGRFDVSLFQKTVNIESLENSKKNQTKNISPNLDKNTVILLKNEIILKNSLLEAKTTLETSGEDDHIVLVNTCDGETSSSFMSCNSSDTLFE